MERKKIAIIIVVLVFFHMILYQLLRDRSKFSYKLLQNYPYKLFCKTLDGLLYYIDPHSNVEPSLNSSGDINKLAENQERDAKRLYVEIIRKHLTPWLAAAVNVTGGNVHVEQPFHMFSNAHLLELKLLSGGAFGHYRITRYVKKVDRNGNKNWIRNSGKPVLQFVPLPCDGLAVHNITPAFLKEINRAPFTLPGWWNILEHIINISKDYDLPDHVDLFIWSHDNPWPDKGSVYRFPPLRKLISDMQENPVPPPVLSYCARKTTLTVPFLYASQLLEKPVEKLINKLISSRNRSVDELEETLSQFERRNDTAVWRGSTTGQMYDSNNWLHGHRSKLIQLSMIAPHLLDARFTRCSQCLPGVEQTMRVSLGRWWGAPMLDSETYYKAKFLIDVEGNSWSSRFYELMLTGALVFKVKRTNQCDEFWYDFLKSDIDFVSIAEDFHDLFSKLLYYRAHPSEALRIVNNGMKKVKLALRSDIWPQYATGILRALSALQTTPNSTEDQKLESLNLLPEGCPFFSASWCTCRR